MEDLNLILNLPLATIGALAAGYLGYRVAHSGIDQGHQTADVLFNSLVFALVAKLVIDAGTEPFGSTVAVGVGLTASVAAAAVWRKWGASTWFKFARRARFAMSDRHQSVLHTIISREGHKPTQLTVKLKNGSRMMCEALHNFNSAPFGPCLLAPDGSVALYVTDFCTSTSDAWQPIDPVDNDWGYALTIIPADEIAEIEVRYAS